MKQIEFNSISTGCSGNFANQVVLRRRAGTLLVCKVPTASSVPPTDEQTGVRNTFKEAASYAKYAIKDKDIRKIYRGVAKRGVSVYNTAVADYFQAPKILAVSTKAYTGMAGDIIEVRAEDDVLVTGVTVELFSADGQLLESGEAVMPENKPDWQYTATQANANLTGTRVVATAKDLPGNETFEELVLT